MTLLFAGIIFDMTQVFGFIFVFIFLGNLNNINSSGCIVILTTSMMFIFLRSLNLKLICINR